MIKLPVSQNNYAEYQTELDNVVYTIITRYVQPPNESPFYTLDLLDGDNVALYQGVKLVSGAQLCDLSKLDGQPQGFLGVALLSDDASDPPNKEDFLNERAILFYDDTAV